VDEWSMAEWGSESSGSCPYETPSSHSPFSVWRLASVQRNQPRRCANSSDADKEASGDAEKG
jgi:hypothetical protein